MEPAESDLHEPEDAASIEANRFDADRLALACLILLGVVHRGYLFIRFNLFNTLSRTISNGIGSSPSLGSPEKPVTLNLYGVTSSRLNRFNLSNQSITSVKS